jgi:hypothetical protein
VPEWRSKYLHLMMRRGRKTAKVAMARKLAVRLYWMWRKGWDYAQWSKFGSQGRKSSALMLDWPPVRFGSRGCEVRESF